MWKIQTPDVMWIIWTIIWNMFSVDLRGFFKSVFLQSYIRWKHVTSTSIFFYKLSKFGLIKRVSWKIGKELFWGNTWGSVKLQNWLHSPLAERSEEVFHGPTDLISLPHRDGNDRKIVLGGGMERNEGLFIPPISSLPCFVCLFTYYHVYRGHYINTSVQGDSGDTEQWITASEASIFQRLIWQQLSE